MVVYQIPCGVVLGKKSHHTIVIRKKVVVPLGQKVLPEAVFAFFLSRIHPVGEEIHPVVSILGRDSSGSVDFGKRFIR